TLMLPFSKFAQGFNWAFDKTSNGYGRLTHALTAIVAIVLVVYGLLLVLTWWRFSETPVGFIPNQDQGYLITIVQLPAGASLSRTDAVTRHAAAILKEVPG